MTNKKFIIYFSIVLAVLCAFQLSFTWAARNFESKARKFAEAKSKTTGKPVSRLVRDYIDSLGSKKMYLGYTYFETKQREINLGLDLRGGMNVILEVDKAEIVKGLSNNSADPVLQSALKEASITIRDKGGDFVDEFISNYKKANPSRKLALLFAKDKTSLIQADASDETVRVELNRSIDQAIDQVYQVVEKRINQSNVTQPTLQKTSEDRISVELPGVENPKRMEELVEKAAKLEFYEVLGNDTKNRTGLSDLLEQLYRASASNAAGKLDTLRDTTGRILSIVAKEDTTIKGNVKNSPLEKLMPRILYPGDQQSFATASKVKAADREKLEEYLKEPRFRNILESKSLVVMFGAKPGENSADGKVKLFGQDEYEVYFLKTDKNGNAALTSQDDNIIEDARKDRDYNSGGRVSVSMNMTTQAANRWSQLTGANIGCYIAIALDKRIYSAPIVNDKISGGRSQISGNFDDAEADDLANVLAAGKLPAPARIVASEIVGPSLGAESIKKGTLSLAIGFILVLAFMILYYNRAGWFAIVAVLGNVFLILGVLASLGAALTLPGIASIILTVGMAVDANVLIYERIKEELRGGRNLRNAIAEGFKNALSAIVDSNLTTLIAGLVLLFAGAGPVYGFAIILVIGIFSSMFTALVITRWLLDYRAKKGKNIEFEFAYNKDFLRGKSIDFVGNRKKYYIISLSVIVLGVVAFIMKGGINTGIDFKGGNAYLIQFDPAKKYSVDAIKTTLDKAFPGTSNEVKTYGEAGQFRVVTTYMLNVDSSGSKEKAEREVTKVLSSNFTLTKNKAGEGPVLSTSKIGAAIATSTRNKSSVLVVIAIFLIFAYIVFRFRSIAYAAGATMALLHDVLVVLSMFAILDGVVPFPTDFDQNLIAALLTLIGYSINDTVIVFDRIREFLTSNRGEKNNASLINGAINDTLSRTIITSSTVFFVLLVLFLFGGDALKGFSLALLIGVIVGTYSSICIATPIVMDLSKKDKKQ